MKAKILRDQKIQDDRRVEYIKSNLDRNRHAMSAGDIVNYHYLSKMNTNEPNFSLMEESTCQTLLESSILVKSLHHINRSSVIKGEFSENNSNEENTKKLVEALDYIEKSTTILDPSRFLFEAARLFDEIGMVERSIECYLKSTITVSPEMIVDAYDLPETIEYKRKLERMSNFQKDKFLEKRNAQRNELIFMESKRQRLRALVSHSHLVRLFLISEDAGNAHNSLCESCRLCSSNEERNEVFFYLHTILKQFADKNIGDYRQSQQVVCGQKGILSESHHIILLNLVELPQYKNNPDIHEWLGIRFTEKSDFINARKHFKMMRDLIEIETSDADLLNRYRIIPEGMNDKELYDSITKKKVHEFSHDIKVDEELAKSRQDYIGFYVPHQRSDTRLFSAPSQGWSAGVEGQQRRLELLNQSFSLPPTITKVQK